MRPSALLLLLFLCLAVPALLYFWHLRKRLIQRQITIDILTRQIAVRDQEIKVGDAHMAEAQASYDKLTREFHHRVKNSLQIIQSYLALSRRQKPAPHNIHLAEAEAKVQVISTAYRLALSDGAMSSIPMRAFVQEIIDNTQAILGGSFIMIHAAIEPDGPLELDRAVPLGLSIVEAVTAALGAPAVMRIKIRIQSEGPGEAVLIVTTDDTPASINLPVRLMAGLRLQLGAHAETCVGDEILRWRFTI